MTSPAASLDFFVLEAGEYIDRLDVLLASAASSSSGPDADAIRTAARSLRGSATMARQYGISQVAGAVERAARCLREGSVAFDAGLHATLVSTVDDLRLLLRAARYWSAAEDRRVTSRLAELGRMLPPTEELPRSTPPTGVGVAFLANQATGLAGALQRLVDAPDDAPALTEALERVRTLRGLAALRDAPALADVVDAVEREAKLVTLGPRSATTPQRLAFFTAAAGALRLLAREIGAGRVLDRDMPMVREVTAAAVALADGERGSERIVPIATLFHTDEGPHIVSASVNPPTTLSERFRLEAVSQAEHLRRLVADAGRPGDAAAKERIARELRAALREIGRLAASFGERQVAHFASGWLNHSGPVDGSMLAALAAAAEVLANPGTRTSELVRRLERLTPESVAQAEVSAAASHPGGQAVRQAAAQPAVAPAAPPPRPPAVSSRTPTGEQLYRFLDEGLAGFAQLGAQPLREPVALAQDEVVPIQSLLYQGRSALARAIEIREELRLRRASPSPQMLEELYDLLDLAAAD